MNHLLFEQALAESHLVEADKTRFIRPAYEACAEDIYLKRVLANNVGRDEDEVIPPIEDMIKWVNSGDADKYQIQWQKLKPMELFNELIMRYWMRYEEKEDSNLKKHPENLFKDEALFKIVDETSKWLFVAPLSYEAAKQMDSFKFGGAGAKWCIGYERTDKYWLDYIEAGDIFVMAMSKDSRKWGTDFVKYMCQFMPDGKLVVWKQSDDPDDTLGSVGAARLFEIDPQTILDKIEGFWRENIYFSGKKFVDVTRILEEELDWTADVRDNAFVYLYNIPTTFDYTQLMDYCTNSDEITRCVIAGKNFPTFAASSNVQPEYTHSELYFRKLIMGNYNRKRDNAQGHYQPGLMIANVQEILIADLFIDNDIYEDLDLLIREAGEVHIKNITYFKEAADYEQFSVDDAIKNFIWLDNAQIERNGGQNFFDVQGGVYDFMEDTYSGNFLISSTYVRSPFIVAAGQSLAFDFRYQCQDECNIKEDLCEPKAEDADEYKEIKIYNFTGDKLIIPFSLSENTMAVRLYNCHINNLMLVSQNDVDMVKHADDAINNTMIDKDLSRWY